MTLFSFNLGVVKVLTKRQNLLETIRGGAPDRFVNQFEFIAMPNKDPFNVSNPALRPGGEVIDLWGIKWIWPEGTPGGFPVYDAENVVVRDVTKWRERLKLPDLSFAGELWADAEKAYARIDRNEVFAGFVMFPGLFEFTHSIMGMERALINFYEEPESMHEIIEAQTNWECSYVEMLAEHCHPDAVLHHDDWGSQISTFMSPQMFGDFFLEPYKRLYECYRDNGFELIVHHSDSYAATLVPYMIEMGVDIWQGAMKTNDIPGLISKYGSKLSIMAGVDTADVDKPGWTQEDVEKAVRWACEECGGKYFIPCQTQGEAGSTFEGVYDAISAEIDKMSKKMF